MKIHANARTCPNSRRLLVHRIEEENWSLMVAAEAAGISERSARKWLGRWRAEGEAGLLDRSSAPKRGALAPAGRAPGGDRGAAAAADDGGGDRRGARHGALDGLAVAVADRAREAGRLEPPEPPDRYQRKRPGELIHIDIKKLGRIAAGPPGHRRPARTAAAPGSGKGRLLGGRLGVRPRLRRRRHPPRLRRGPARRERHHRRRLPAPRGRLVRTPGHHGRAGDDRQRLRLPLSASTPACGGLELRHSAPGPIFPGPTARPSASSRRSPTAGPTARSMAPQPSAPRRCPAGSTTTTSGTTRLPWPSTARSSACRVGTTC